MSIPPLLRAATLAVAALLVTSCGGGGGGGGGGGNEEPPPPPPPGDGIPPAPSTPIALSTEAHVLREIGNAIEVYSAFFNLDLAKRADAAALRAKAVIPKAAEPVACERGGTRTIEEGTADRTFTFFDVSQGVTFVTEVTEHCDENVAGADGIHRITDGRLEQGDTPVGMDNVSHAYERYGVDAQNRYAEDERDDGAPNDFDRRDALGLVEFVLSPTQQEMRSVIERRFEQRTGATYRAATVIRGATGDPFILRFDHAGDTLRFDGPYRYATRTCAGGLARVTTLQPVTLDETDIPNGGQLQFSNGTNAVQVTFNGDGTATYQFVGGASGMLDDEDIVTSPGLC